jgi:hypothetical protein
MPDPTREELKKAAEHIIALCNKHGISESDESRVVASAFLSAFEREEKMLEALKELHTMVKCECPSLLNEDSGGNAYLDMACDTAIKAAEEGR